MHGKRNVVAILFHFSMEKARLGPLEGLRNDLGKTGQAWEHEYVVLFGFGVLMDDVESRA